jgi:hypothetical protein
MRNISRLQRGASEAAKSLALADLPHPRRSTANPAGTEIGFQLGIFPFRF